jgi:hypothetical protein
MINIKIIYKYSTLLILKEVDIMKIYRLVFYILGVFIILGCSDKEDSTGDLNITMNLIYNGEPLIMFQDYEYPDGRTINFSRFSLYLSDMKLDEQLISDVGFYTITDSHVDLAGATAGYQWQIKDIEPGNYNSLNFGVGVNETQNAKDPGLFESGHPLAKPAEHWFSWSSFIFLKLEANMDSNNDGNNDFPLALHLGADDAYRIINLNKAIKITGDETSETNIIFDLYEFLGGNDNTYDVDSNPQIHSLEQLDAVVELADNIPSSVK